MRAVAVAAALLLAACASEDSQGASCGVEDSQGGAAVSTTLIAAPSNAGNFVAAVKENTSLDDYIVTDQALAEFGVNVCNYLSQGFSRSSLIDQMTWQGYNEGETDQQMLAKAATAGLAVYWLCPQYTDQ